MGSLTVMSKCCRPSFHDLWSDHNFKVLRIVFLWPAGPLLWPLWVVLGRSWGLSERSWPLWVPQETPRAATRAPKSGQDRPPKAGLGPKRGQCQQSWQATHREMRARAVDCTRSAHFPNPDFVLKLKSGHFWARFLAFYTFPVVKIFSFWWGIQFSVQKQTIPEPRGQE